MLLPPVGRAGKRHLRTSIERMTLAEIEDLVRMESPVGARESIGLLVVNGAIRRGAMAQLARECNVSRERIRQLVRKFHPNTKIISSRSPQKMCTKCGKPLLIPGLTLAYWLRTTKGERANAGIHKKCWDGWITTKCAWCGKRLKKGRSQMKRATKTGRHFCHGSHRSSWLGANHITGRRAGK